MRRLRSQPKSTGRAGWGPRRDRAETARVTSSSPWAQCLALPLRPSSDTPLSREDLPDPAATAPRPLVASASHRSRAPRHPRDPGERPAQPIRPRQATGTRDARLPGGGGEYYTTEGGPGAQIGQRDGTRGPARSAPRLRAPIAGGFAQRGRRVEKTGREQLAPRVPRPPANGEAVTYPERAREPEQKQRQHRARGHRPRRAAPALARCPASLAAAMLRPRPPCCSPRSPPGLREPGQVGRRRAPSGRCVRRPRSRPRLCSARSELQVKPCGGPAEAPPLRPGLTRALKEPLPCPLAQPPGLVARWPCGLRPSGQLKARLGRRIPDT